MLLLMAGKRKEGLIRMTTEVSKVSAQWMQTFSSSVEVGSRDIVFMGWLDHKSMCSPVTPNQQHFGVFVQIIFSVNISKRESVRLKQQR